MNLVREKLADMSSGGSLNDDIISQVAKDYSQYLTINAANERQQFDDSIDVMLTRLDEYLGLVSLIRSDSNLCLETTLPMIQDKAEQMTKIFDRIDRLEAFVAVVKQNMAVTEENLIRAETELGSRNALQKMLTSISMPAFLSKSKPSRANISKKFVPPEIFKTSDYLQNISVDHAQPNYRAQQVMAKQEQPGEAAVSTPPGEDSGTWPAIGET